MGLRTPILVAIAIVAASLNAEVVRWRLSESYARSECARTGKLMMLDLYGDGRGSSASRMLLETYADASVVDCLRSFVPMRLSMLREGADLARRLRINKSGIVFLDPSGKPVHRIRGFHTPRGLIFEMKKALEAHRDLPIFKKRLEMYPNDSDAAARLAMIKALAFDGRAALALMNRAEKLIGKPTGQRFVDAYGAIGDYFQLSDQLTRAIPYFRKAGNLAMTPYDRAYAQISIGSCFLVMRDMERAKAELKQVLNIAGVHEEEKQIAVRLLSLTGHRVTQPTIR